MAKPPCVFASQPAQRASLIFLLYAIYKQRPTAAIECFFTSPFLITVVPVITQFLQGGLFAGMVCKLELILPEIRFSEAFESRS